MSGDHNQHQKPTSKESLQVEAITPAVWVCMDNDRVMRFRFDKPKDIKNWKPMYSEPPQEDWQAIAADQAMTIAMMKSEQAEFQALVAKVQELEKQACEIIRREWVSLTDDDITELFCDYDDSQFPAFVRAIEAKLKEKNTSPPKSTPKSPPKQYTDLCGND
jgi:hypothetical protein